MRNEAFIYLVVVALCTCVVAVERPAQVSPGDIFILASDDPNDANEVEDRNKIWDPAEHLAADWISISVSMTSQIYNPVVQPDAQIAGPQWSMVVASSVDITDSNGLIGWALTPKSVQAFDQDGALVCSAVRSNLFARWYQQPQSWSTTNSLFSPLLLDQVRLSLPMDPNAPYPEMFGRVEWSMDVLSAEKTKTVDIPFAVGDTWVELTPGFEILVELATVEEGKYQYRIKAKYDTTRVDYMMGGSIHVWKDQMLPPALIVNMDVLNAQGKSIRSLDGSGGFSTSASYVSSDGLMTGTASGSGSCSACGTAATFRYTLAFDLREQEANFVLENIPVPEF
ncbi:MAG: hypothetical protein KBE65_21920 [Phycisphaerae bacterium]|nr:hypothetical protein [Phycisphaerae bacterium]